MYKQDMMNRDPMKINRDLKVGHGQLPATANLFPALHLFPTTNTTNEASNLYHRSTSSPTYLSGAFPFSLLLILGNLKVSHFPPSLRGLPRTVYVANLSSPSRELSSLFKDKQKSYARCDSI